MQNTDKEKRLNSPTEEPSVQALICPLRLCSLAELCSQSAGAFQVYENKKTDTVKRQGRRKLISLNACGSLTWVHTQSCY